MAPLTSTLVRSREAAGGEPAGVQLIDAVLAHRCSSRLLSIEAELAGVARHRGRLPGCDVSSMIARRQDGLWEIAEAGECPDADARLGLELVLEPDRLAGHAAHERWARERFAAAADGAAALDSRSPIEALAASFDDLFAAYGDFLAAYRLTNERFWSGARAWLLDELRRAGGRPELLPELLWIDMSGTATVRESRAWETLVLRAGLQQGAGLERAVAEHAEAFGHLFGDQVFGDVDPQARIWQRLRDGQIAPGRGPGEIAALAERRERTLARLDLGARARAAIDAMRALALLRLLMREHMLRCNARTREFFEEIASRLGLAGLDRHALRFLSRQDIAGGLAGDAAVTAEALEARRRSGVCALVDGEVRTWSILGAARPPAAGSGELRGQVVQPGPAVIGRVVRASRLEEIEPARAAAGPGPHVLVVPMLHPAMIVAAGSFSAVLAAEGGLLSHAAMLAREYRIPCITGLGDLAGLGEGGRRVAVDPARGTVAPAPPGGAREIDPADPADPCVAQGEVAWSRLDRSGELGRDRFGGKTAALRRLFAALPIPEGLCLGSDATRHIADWDSLCRRLFPGGTERDQLSPADHRFVDDWFEQVAARWRPPARLEQALLELGPCVVRSSSADEDRTGSSSAGLLTSVTSARPAAELPAALAEVLRSALSPAYLAYRAHRSLAGPPPCPALLIQRRIACVASGVLTTWRPAGAPAGRLTVAVAPGFAGSESRSQLVFGVDPDAGGPIELYQAGDRDPGVAGEASLEAYGLSTAGVRALSALSGPLRRAGLEEFEIEWCIDRAQRPFVVQVRDRGGEQ